MGGMALPQIARLTEQMMGELVECRRHLHQFPELSGQEEQTARLVAGRLLALGLEVTAGVGGHGVVGLLRGGAPGPVLALRADMDALPIQDRKPVPYASRVPGIMHACGHDVHTTCLLGAATVLSRLRAQVRGTVKFIFQPAEETNQGARAMIADGVLQSPPVDAIIALHVSPDVPAGSLAVNDGAMMAAEDNFDIRITGEAGHAAMPHLAADALLASAQVIQLLQTIVSRNVDPLEPAVLSITTINGGEAKNVIASTVQMGGTVRTLSPQVREQIPRRIRMLLEAVSVGMGCGADLEYRRECPPTVNDRRLVEQARAVLTEAEGEGLVRPCQGLMASEDFAWYLERVPGMFMWLGAAPGSARGPGLHTPLFDVDERALQTGVRTLVELALGLPDHLC